MSKPKSLNKPTTPAAVSRVQRAVAIQNGGKVPKGSYVCRMQRAIAQSKPATGVKSK